jgi:predicted permease
MWRRRRETRVERDVRLEIEHHVAASTEYLIQQGVSADAARAEAIRRLGSLDQAQQRLHPYARDREVRMRIRESIASLAHDVRYSGRALARERSFTGLLVLTLALGIGVNAAMFGILDRLLLRGPDHVRDAGRVLRVYYTGAPNGTPPATFSANGYAAYTALGHAGSFEAVAAYTTAWEQNLGEGLDAERVLAQNATWTLFPLLGARPALGRFFSAADDTPPNGQPLAVLSHRLWTRRFAANPAAIGRRIVLNGDAYTVIGVAPRGFTGAELGRVDVWIPVSAGRQRRPDWPTTWSAKWLHAIARLRPGVSAEAAAAEATTAYRNAYDGRAAFEREHRLSLRPLRYDRTGDEPLEATVGKWAAGVAAVVLLVACANVATLLLARSLRRRREIAVRTALGVTRWRLARLIAAEIVVLAGAAAAVGLLIAYWGGHLMRSVLLPAVAWDGPALDYRVLVFTASAALATALLVGLVPIREAMRFRLTDSLRDGAPQAGRVRARLRQTLSAAQAGLSVLLLIGAGLFVQSLLRVQSLDLGIEPARVLAVSLQWPPLTSLAPEQRDGERVRRQVMTQSTLTRLRTLAGVESAAAAIGVPFESMFGLGVRVPEMAKMPRLPGGGPYVSAVGQEYFRTVGTGLMRGRVFTDADGPGERVAIVNESMARAIWPGDDALDKCILIADRPCARIVGVVEDARRFALREDPAMQFYVPLEQAVAISGTTLLVRPAEPHPIGVDSLRRELFALDPTLAYVNVTALQDRIDPQVRPWRLGAALFVTFGALAFLIAALGLYSVIAYTTAQRTHEIGVRIALGARSADVLRLVLTSTVATAAAGIGAGVLAALAAGPHIEPLLFDTSARSPVVFAVVIAVLLASVLLAGTIPARRAARVDPMVALRP